MISHHALAAISLSGVVLDFMGGLYLAYDLVEWWADTLPAQRLGLLGAILLLVGFALQSLQYWVTLLNVEIR